jgi:UDP-N-acetylmuramate dehydrogenase
VPLAPRTTIGLGGAASYLVDAVTDEDLLEALEFARQKRLAVRFLGGGSNLIFSDSGFRGMVICIRSTGIERMRGSAEPLFSVRAGHPWDEFVAWSVQQNWAGVECLSGIPGSTGGVPVQNVGAYGQEASDSLVRVRAFDTSAQLFVEIAATDCEFGYRTSRFKHREAGRFVITDVVFRLRDTPSAPRYPELIRAMESQPSSGGSAVQNIRAAVLALRRKKSMVYSPSDPDSKSCGSFFTNPVLSEPAYGDLCRRLKESSIELPQVYAQNGSLKVPAAFLIEKAGFTKGYELNGAGISTKHALALVNRGCTAAALMELAGKIQTEVRNRFGVSLEMEPEYIAV